MEPTPQRVLLVTPEYPPHATGGAGTYALLLARDLARRGLAVDVLVPGITATGELPGGTSVQEEGGARVHRVAPSEATRVFPFGSRAYRDAFPGDLTAHGRALVAARRPDVVHCMDWFLFGVARELATAAGAPLVTTVMLLYHPVFSYWGQRMPSAIVEKERASCRGADAVITNSGDMRRLIHEAHGVPLERVHVVYNGVDAASFARADGAAVEALRRDLAPGGEPVVLFAGRITRQKGIAPLLESALRVLAVRPEVRYLLAGPVADPLPDPANPSEVIARMLAAHPPLARAVRLLGNVPRERLAALYRLATLAVVPSVYEPFGYAAVEAMASGVPVVATATGGLREIVTDGVDGLLVPVRAPASGPHEVDVAALADAQLALLSDPALAARLRDAGLARVRDFSVERMTDETLRVYRGVAAVTPPPP